MSYSTVQMVRLALYPLSGSDDGTNPPTTPSNTPADLENTQIQDAIDEADSLIDAYIGKYYATPVAPIFDGSDEDGTVGSIPHPIDYWSRNIAAYNATLSYRQGLDFADTDPVARRYIATMAALTMISKGQATLQLPDNVSVNAATGAGQPVNPYVGDLFDPNDWNLRPLNTAWPMWPDVPEGWGGSTW